MSTRGSFILRKDGIEKSLYISCDAYPSYTATRIVRLIKEYDLTKLYDLMVEDESSDYYWFSAEDIMDYMRDGKSFDYRDNKGFILDSLMCEYAYVIDTDKEELEYYIGFQKVCQKGNRYGEEVTYVSRDGKTNYYPCRLCAVFSFAYIKKNITDTVISVMQECNEDQENIKLLKIDETVQVGDNDYSNKEDGKHLSDLRYELVQIRMKLFHELQNIDALISGIYDYSE